MPRRFHYPSVARFLTVCFFLVAIVLSSFSAGLGQSAATSPTGFTKDSKQISASQEAAAALPSEPTGESRCLICHPSEVEGYARSAMAHSLRRAGQEPEGIVNVHGSKITMHSESTGYWQYWENGGDSSQYRVDYVVGSGIHASGYLVNLGGHLFQSPVAYYASRKGYDLAPGYENLPDPDFTRPVSEECVLCHSGTALHVAGTLNQYREPIFAAESITCERCHGPAEKHLADPRAGTIINPAKLAPAARDSVCEQCHLFGAARVTNPGKSFSDFLPGQTLEDTFTVYRNAVPAGSSAGDFKVISHVEQLALSTCSRKSEGKLWCGTCHDPHDKPTQAVEYYRAKCLTCHIGNFPAAHPAKDSDCLSCHMPRRDAKDGGHTAFTDHRIQRRPEVQPELPKDVGIVAWREPLGDLQKRNIGIASVDVGIQRHSSALIVQGYRALAGVQRRYSNDSELFKWIGEALLLGKQTSDAKIAMERALQLDPDSALTEASAAAPYIQEGDTKSAIAHLERAVSMDPLNLTAASILTGLYQKEGKTAEAEALSSKIKAAMSASPSVTRAGVKSFAEDSGKRTEEIFKNIQVLKGIPVDQLIPAMEFISSSLGVQCSFCHVENHFEKDDKKPKKTARAMMQMEFAINKGSFEGHREVTCYSCHRGSRDPVETPAVSEQVAEKGPGANSDAGKISGELPSAHQLIENYINALGGADAIRKITSRTAKGAETFEGSSEGIETFTQVPDKQAVVRHYLGGDSVTVINGSAGWYGATHGPVHDLHGSDLEAAREDADLQFALHIEERYPELRVEYPETVAGRAAFVLAGVRGGRVAAKFYFDKQTKLLIRLVRYAESPLGRNPTRTDYADYRDAGGVQVPFRVVVSRPGSRSTVQLESAEANVSIDEAKFAKPASGTSSKQTSFTTKKP